ncbi:phage tail length tape measure family protein [Sphingobium sp. UBA5915]|uniref:phage tail length tape measure family protein n=1 Tax=Sphingobium sp. UBA5915 TaxID=1947530 RepID=UPI0025E68D48|nr:phage tail length tape measure family protein [Sphingobium sp. UBA5915]
MDVAALSMNIDSSKVVQAANDLDRFAASSDRAAASAAKVNFGNQAGSIARLVASVQSIDNKMSALISTLTKAQQAERALATANDNAATSMAKAGAAVAAADSHVIAYTQHLAGLAAAQRQADAHVVAYRNSLASIPKVTEPAVGAVDRLATRTAASAGAMKANTGNIAAQFQDIGVTAAMGMSPLIIALQQGTQLSAVFAQTGGSTLATLKAAFLSLISPVSLVTIALVAGAAALIQLASSGSESADAAYRAENGLKTYTTQMGYTKKEVEKLNSVTVTFGDTTKAVFQVALREAAASMGVSVEDMAKTWEGFLDRLLTGTRATMAGIYAALAGTRSYLAEIEKGGVIGLGKMMIGQGDPDLLAKTYGKAYQDAQKFMDDVSAQAAANARKRQGDMAKAMYDAPKAKGGKTDAEKLADILRSAQAEVTAEKARAEAVGMSARAAAELEQRTKLLNQIEKAKIPVTAAVRAEVDKLASAYASAKVAGETAQAIQQVTDSLEQQRSAINDETALIGTYGDELIRTKAALEAVTAARNALPRGETLSPEAATRIAADAGLNANDQINQNRVRRMETIRKDAEDAAYAMDLERKGLMLTGAAAESYAYVIERLNEAKRQGIDLSPDEIAAIKAAGEAYGQTRYAIDQQAKAIADAREVTKGFLSDWITGVREGGNVFKTFAGSVVNSLNRIIDKLMDRAIDKFLDMAFTGGGGGGFFGSLMSSIGLGGSTTKNALGGVYGTPQRFAKGSAFTNSVVNTPTLFRFANGAALGEMGEAGPEAIMPLKRGANGALGVQMHGGGGRKIEVKVSNYNSFAGAIGVESIAAMNQQAAEATYEQVERNLTMMIQKIQTDGAVVS